MHNVDDVAKPLVAEMCRVAGERVFIIEEVSPRRKDRYSYVKRNVDEYVAMCAPYGMVLENVEYLHHEILQKMCRGPRRLLNPKGTHEGATRNNVSRAVERSMIGAFGWVDDAVKLKSGLARIAFRRKQDSA